jgi:peptidyl-dipeptidase Dcp
MVFSSFRLCSAKLTNKTTGPRINNLLKLAGVFYPNQMRKYCYILFMMTFAMSGCSENTNPLTTAFKTPFETPPFDLVRHDHYAPAFREAIEQGLQEVKKVATSAEAPTFQNTIEALARSGELLSRVSDIFYNLNSAETDARMQEIAREVAPWVSDYSNDILFNKELFERIHTVYDQREALGLNPEQYTLLEKTYRSFYRNGALLNEDGQSRLREISRELSELSLRFQDNVLAETNAFLLHLTNEKDLAGLPETAVDAAAQLARSRNLEGWAFSLHAPSYLPFMQYADNRELRQRLFMAYAMRANQDNEYDNKEILQKIANLRLERARLLGYPTYADFVLEERMAENPGKVNDLLNQLLTAARPNAEREVEEIRRLAADFGAEGELMPWDWSWYSEKLRKQRFDLDEEALRPYFELESVKQGVFELTRRLWGLNYVRNRKIPVYHPDVDVYEVYEEDGAFLAILYLDFFPREGKSPGAWMTSFRSQQKQDDKDIRPHISVVCNFSKPTGTRPSLLTFQEVTTFLHEFGHALHGMMSDVTYPTLSGTSVYRDFVELPSMIMENWAVEKDFLDLFAVHYETGERIPEEMVRKIIEARNFNAGYGILRQLGFGLNDMAWHSITDSVVSDIFSFERQAMQPAALLPAVDQVLVSPAFAHIFAGGYAAGYYSYKWSEVLDADAFRVFRENGIFDRETAASFREHILAMGGSEHPMTLYKRFRGQEPAVDALLERDGLK